MVTYPEIYELLRQEKYNEKLQNLGKKFLSDVSAYLSEKKVLLKREKRERPGLFSDTLERTRKQLENAKSMIRELLMIREKKIVELALIASRTGVSKGDLAYMLKHEKELFNTVLEKLGENEKNLSLVFEGVKEARDDNLLVRFKEKIPRFVDLKGNELGPFSEEDVANLPQKIAKALIGSKKAEIINI